MEVNGAERIAREMIMEVPDFPKKGVLFRDITPLLGDSGAWRMCVDELAGRFKGSKTDYVAGIEARGFIIGAALAYAMGVGFVPVRKKGKLPRKTASRDYALEYGSETVEVHRDAVARGSGVLIADDLLATGGTARAAAELIEGIGANVVGFAFMVELSQFNGIAKLGGKRVERLVRY